MKLKKPDVDAFKLILENNLAKKCNLYYDSIQHINAAKTIGINTIFLEKIKML